MRGHDLLMIPGPVDFEPEVLQALGAPTTSHVAPAFIEVFGRALERMRAVWQCPSGQPLVVAGSGTLAMELAGANLVVPGDRALVISTGVFGDRFEDLLRRHGAEVTVLRAPLGGVVEPDRVEDELRRRPFKLLTVTHVDTSTAVRMPVEPLGELGRRHGVLTVVDGVCSVAAEEIKQEAWGLDVVLTASQKAIGVPPGLALLVASPAAIDAFAARREPVRSYYADWGKWLPIMQSYEARRPSYFGTPAVNLVAALDVSLGRILDEGLAPRFARHALLSGAFRAGVDAIGLRQLPLGEKARANTLTACYYPDGVAGQALLAAIGRAGVTVAGGLHGEIKDRYFRVGHMGAVRAADILGTLGALETGLQEAGHRFEPGAGVAAAQRALSR
jgi:alanine-glyoxylate transaminase/serine-glyoxylate transaminase/serine-pyruvate transaminase